MAPTALLASTIVAARVQQASGTRARRAAACPQQLRAPCPANVRSLPSARNARQSVAVAAGRFQPIVFAAAAAPPDWQTLAKAEIPTHIPRPDFLKQMYTWAVQHVATDSQKTYGSMMQVETVDEKQADGEVLTVAFDIVFVKYLDDKKSQRVLSLRCSFDDEMVPVYDMVDQDENTGMPVMTTRDGKKKTTKGKCFIVKRDKSISAPKEYLAPVNKLLQNTMEAVNKYYAFGSTFSEDF